MQSLGFPSQIPGRNAVYISHALSRWESRCWVILHIVDISRHLERQLMCDDDAPIVNGLYKIIESMLIPNEHLQ